MKNSNIPSGRRGPLASSTGTRERLLKSATLELVAQKGSVELADVTRRAGVSAGAPYHHFGSKSGLIAAVVDDFYERYDKSVMDVEFEGARWIDREELRVQGMVEFHYNEPLAPIVLSKLDRDPAIAQVEARWLSRHISKGARNISKAQRDGDVSPHIDPEFAAAMILGGIRQLIVHALARKSAPKPEALSREIRAYVVAISQADPRNSTRKGGRRS